MNKEEKIKALATAMTTSKRAGEDDSFYHFSATAPEELKDLYLEHYRTLRDIDYETFSRACDIVSEIYTEKPDISDDDATDDIYERASDSANPYTSVALSYLNSWNQEEIGETAREIESDIATACMYWYDKQVEQAAIIINEWINKE